MLGPAPQQTDYPPDASRPLASARAQPQELSSLTTHEIMQNESGGATTCPLPGSAAGPGADIMASVSALFASTASDHNGGFVFRTPPLLRGDLLPPAEELCRLLQHRRGKGGRQPASDPRLDPRIDAKKAKRILANRQSAARSKMKQKAFMDGLRAQQTLLKYQKDAVARELGQLAVLCKQLDDENNSMLVKIQALSNQYRIQSVLFSKLCEQRNKLLSDAMQPSAAGPTPTADATIAPAATANPPLPHAHLPGATPPAALQAGPTLTPLPHATMAPPSQLPLATAQQPAAAAGWPDALVAATAPPTIAAALPKVAVCNDPSVTAAAASQVVSNSALWQALDVPELSGPAPAPQLPTAAAAAVGAAMPGAAPADLLQTTAGVMAEACIGAQGTSAGQAAAAAAAATAAQAVADAAGASASGATARQRSCQHLLPPHLGGQRLALCA